MTPQRPCLTGEDTGVLRGRLRPRQVVRFTFMTMISMLRISSSVQASSVT